MGTQREKDRVWLVLCTATGIIVEVTLNKFSSELPVLVVLALWVVPPALFVVWFWRVEATKSWVKTRFIEHPFSYILLLALVTPFLWQITVLMIHKLNQSTPHSSKPLNSDPAPKRDGDITGPSEGGIKSASPAIPKTPVRLPSKGRTIVVAPRVPAIPQAGTMTQTNTGSGVSIQQGTTAPNSPIINSPITVGDVPRRIAAKDITALSSFLSGAPEKPRIIVVADQTSDARGFPTDFYKVLKDAGWRMQSEGVSDAIGFMAPGSTFQGAVISIRGEPLTAQQVLDIRADDPLAYLGQALEALQVPHNLVRSLSVPQGEIIIEFVGGLPKVR